jgi:steroid delta-isomerase-like uncharacterized protein
MQNRDSENLMRNRTLSLFGVTLLVWGLIGLNGPRAARAAELPSEEEMRAAIGSIEEAIAAYDIEGIVTLMPEGAVFDFVPVPPPLVAPDGVRAFWTQHFQSWPDYRTISERLLVEAGLVVTEHVTLGTQSGEWLGIPPTGLEIAPHPHLDIWEFTGPAVSRLTTYADLQSLLVSIGMMPTPELPPLTPSFPLPDPIGSRLDPLSTVVESQGYYNAHDLAGLAARLAADATMMVAPLGVDPLDRASFIALQELYYSSFSDLRMEVVRHLVLEEGWVLSEVLLRGFNDGPYFGAPPARRTVRVRAVVLYQVNAGGLITEMNLYWDNLTVLMQLGWFPPPLPLEEIEAVNDAFGAAMNAHHVELLVSLYAPGAVFDFVPLPVPLTQPDQIAGFLSGLFEAFPDYTVLEEERWIAGSVVVTEHTTMGNQAVEWLGMPPTGAPAVPHRHLDVWDYHGDKIAHLRTYMDSRSMLVNSGVLPKEELPVLTPSFALPEPVGSGLGSVETVMKYQKRKNALDLPGMAQLLAEDVRIYMAALDSTLDRGSAMAIHELMSLGFPDLAFAVQRTVDLGDGWVVTEGAFTGTHTGVYFGIAPAGRSIHVRAAYLYRVDSAGLIVDVRVYYDDLAWLSQMGAFPPLPPDELLARYEVIRNRVLARESDAYLTGSGDVYSYLFVPTLESVDKEGAEEFFAAIFNAWPDFTIDDGLVLAGNNVVVVEHRYFGTFLNEMLMDPFGMVPPTGQEMEIPHVDVLEFVGGELVRAWTYQDYLLQLSQLGLFPPAPPLPPLAPSFEVPAPEPGERTPRETYTAMLAAWNSRDLPAVAELMASDIDVFHGSVNARLSRAEYLALMEYFFSAFPDVQMQPWKTVDLGDGWLVVEATWRGTQTGPYLGLPATGRVGTVPVVGVFQVNDQGLLTYHHAYDDNTTILAQMGVFDPLRVSTQVTAEGVTLSWPLAASQGLVLETSAGLSGAWAPVTTPPVVEGDQYKLTVPITGDAAYFRLHTANP